MDPRDHHSEWSKSEKKEIPYNIPYMQNQKKDTNDLIYKTKAGLQT